MAQFGKPRSSKDLTRQARGFSEYRRVLIVCEGSKTEPTYLRGLLKHLGLGAVSVVVVGEECDSAPISVYQYAAKRYDQEKKIGAFDEVHCVIDRDRHATFDAALKAIQQHPSKAFRAVISNPCFEYWVLLHFRYTRAPFVAAGAASPGDMVVRAVKEEWPEYTKGIDAYSHLQDKMDRALLHAQRARQDFEAVGEANPSTDVDKLVRQLKELAEGQLRAS